MASDRIAVRVSRGQWGVPVGDVPGQGGGGRIVAQPPNAPGLVIPAPRGRRARHRESGREEGAPGAEATPRLPPEQLQAVVDNSPDLVLRYDREGTRLFANRTVAESFGVSVGKLVGTRLGDPVPGSAGDLEPESAARLREGIRRAFDRVEPAQLDVVYSLPGRRQIVQFRLVPETGADGRVLDVLAIGRDVTAVRQIEQELRESRRSYREVFDNALDQMILLEICPDRRYRILEINPAMERNLPFRRKEIIGRYQDELYDEEIDRALSERYQACIDAGSPVQGELTLDLPFGRRRYQATTVPARDESGRIVRVVNIVRDITGRQQEESARVRLERALRTLSSGNEILIRATEEPSLLAGMARVMVEIGGYRRVWIGYPKESTTAPDGSSAGTEEGLVPSGAAQGVDDDLPVAPVAWASADAQEASSDRPDPGWLGPAEPLLAALSAAEVKLCHPTREDGPWADRREDAMRLEIGSCLTMPLVHEDQVMGVLVVHAAQPEAFGPDELRLLMELGADLAYGIHNVRARVEQDRHEERLLKAMNATIRALADTTELRDPYTAGHQRRVAQLAEAVGRRLGLSEDRVAGLYLASTIHDIGKISVPAEILGRPGALSALEYSIVQQHVTSAYELLRGIEFPWPVADIVVQHHERCDGSGYPAGLRAGDLLLESRILAVCDVVEAMWSHRPYRAGLGMEAALAELEAHRGVLYDAEVVDACVCMLREGGFRFS